ncbi:hypothetical protein ABID21_001453 [Pseudorhizobium tarimense]|uniref:DUF3540 domain-containing protein n=1 Tax=Pseudorhizobium tarimense TaxID=1079109 RepID=A0ABV2H466_9HYPH|nr:DUF3540 domain-containing protein [Pseudorhizobium tarimense]MCJ8518576.1 DUF3540 domain-containing protein [Pseudorhizobium tarimense]
MLFTERFSENNHPVEERTGSVQVAPANGLVRALVRAFLTGTEAIVETDAGDSLVVRQAASCLLAPAIGDRVLLHVEGSDGFILAVLERQAPCAAEVSVPGAADMVLRAPGRIDIDAGALGLKARRLDILAGAVLQAGESLTSHFRRISETVVDKIVGARTVTTTAQSRTTAVKEVDVLEAGTLVQTIASVATQNSEIALITAKRDVRLDGERVSVG